MSCFDNVIGYEKIKEELRQICDMIHRRALYEEIGAKMPRGILLYGKPGLGKTMMANAFVAESGLPVYTVRRSESGHMVCHKIEYAFSKAMENAPAIVFLDDMDKFANEDEHRRDAQEYVAVQSAIDECKDKQVFVIATANNVDKLPPSLLRSGRFDHVIEVERPSAEDGRRIIEYYLSTKKVDPDLCVEDLCMMMTYSSCADLETILNEAAIRAAHRRQQTVGMEDLVRTVLARQYETDEPDDTDDPCAGAPDEETKKTALHEAGHLVVCEAILPGSVGLAALRSTNGRTSSGFIHRCKELPRRPHHVLVTLGGKAANELYYSEACASGCQTDLDRAVNLIIDGVTESGTHGVHLLPVTVGRTGSSDTFRREVESVVHAELERFLFKAKDILLKNKEFLEKVAQALIEKRTLLYSDIRAIRESVRVVGAVV